MKIAVIGTGYVGLVTAAGLAEFGHTVIGTDKDSEKIEQTSRGTAPIYELGLDELLKRNLAKGTLTFTADVDGAIRAAGVIFVCVGTPQDENGRADMSQVEGVSGRYFVGSREAEPSEEALDQELAEGFWRACEGLAGLRTA